MRRVRLASRLFGAVLLAGHLAGAVPVAFGGDDHPRCPAAASTGQACEHRTRCDPYCYNSDYLFAVTREMHDGSCSPAVAALVSPLTIAVDLVILPFEIALGLFG